jgi:hypothetical protein
MDIVTTTRTTEQTSLFAAEELKRYLSQMLSSEEGVFSVTLFVETNIDDSRDAYSISMSDDGGTIIGSNARSVLIGVYDYLRYLGCRFLSPNEQTEIIPKVKVSELKTNYKKVAAFNHRGVCIEGANSVENILEFINWLPKVGYNSFFLQFKVQFVFISRWYNHDLNPLQESENFTMEDATFYMTKFEEAMTSEVYYYTKLDMVGPANIRRIDIGSWDEAHKTLADNRKSLAAEITVVVIFLWGFTANTNLCFSIPDAINTFVIMLLNMPLKLCCRLSHIWIADEYNNVCECSECSETTITESYVALLNEIDRRMIDKNIKTKNIIFAVSGIIMASY